MSHIQTAACFLWLGHEPQQFMTNLLQIGAGKFLLVLLIGGMQMTMGFEDMGCTCLVCLVECWVQDASHHVVF